MRERLQHFPISFFAVVMGLAGATIAWQRMESLSWWACTFPPAALTIATLLMYHSNHIEFFQYLAVALLILLSSVAGMLTLITLAAMKNKSICVED